MHRLLSSIVSHFYGNETCIAITGSGGKTTSMIALAALYAKTGQSVLVTTTTKLMMPEKIDYGCDTLFFDDEVLSYRPHPGERVLYGLAGEKLLSPPVEHLRKLSAAYDVMLVEADGSRQMGLKIHSDRDPVVPSFATATLAVASFATMGKPLEDQLFNVESYEDDFPQASVDLHTFDSLLRHPQGILKGARGRKLVLFNQVEPEKLSLCRELSQMSDPAVPLFFGSLLLDTLYFRNKP
jgi:probable selenium-dependent hydroxylase accessory protein YqeC